MSILPREPHTERCVWCYRARPVTIPREPCECSYGAPLRYQIFWRCAHHPIATDNFFHNRMTCEWLCHATKLEWYHGGVHPLPPAQTADKVFGV